MSQPITAGNELPPQLGTRPWLQSHGEGKYLPSTLTIDPHDIYVIGTQEAKVSENEWVVKVSRMLHEQFDQEFHLVSSCITSREMPSVLL